MACSSCGQRRTLLGQAAQQLIRRDTAGARNSFRQVGQTIRTDLRSLGKAVRSPILGRQTRVR